MRTITFTIEVNSAGEAVIRLPEGPGQQQNAAETAKLTDQISKLIGKVKERHIGDHHHHDHGHNHVNA